LPRKCPFNTNVTDSKGMSMFWNSAKAYTGKLRLNEKMFSVGTDKLIHYHESVGEEHNFMKALML
jgi:hypothetical protein